MDIKRSPFLALFKFTMHHEWGLPMAFMFKYVRPNPFQLSQKWLDSFALSILNIKDTTPILCIRISWQG